MIRRIRWFSLNSLIFDVSKIWFAVPADFRWIRWFRQSLVYSPFPNLPMNDHTRYEIDDEKRKTIKKDEKFYVFIFRCCDF
jgi:hypothetical protein